ncbi:hypothetical protein JAO76_01065 [Pontibacter sp. BT310]|uniref:STAS/SEC14 domain-containing protein n=1 Tax=Pontibacter populi TaxID=890055 RepID=A0ABS6X6I2_9BACT|nr:MULTISPECIES: hypothetical protein [Pontibacter]MBJ6116760.1 hypothetical protein [Pontibacter sp. BT310]MBR0569182.1 hypothetical protein [Microvirga sp. STS03]MBW3363613.1 hypothetical protein [Pontibacter populi]
MPFNTVYESDFYKIEVNPEGKVLYSEWLRHVTEEELITGATKLYEVLRDTRIERALANGQMIGSITPKAKEWMSVKFYELLSQTNLKKLARILPVNVFHQLALESVITRAEGLGKTRFQVKNFSDKEEGMKWLLES